ncbi:MAG: SDR family NAD(P)-dependent oxidoreductase [Candidatus Neomarinimicrobiota bacterium]|nr:MAG: SDR family NAD(P)-dependent oxidoreductase [Candidatus Neomarinimicrobiota bacterium]
MVSKRKETVLVTGGAGFIGSHFCQRLLQGGYRVVAVDNLNPFYSPLIKSLNLKELARYRSFRFEKGDIRQRAFLQAVMEKTRPDYVVHLAAMAGVRPSIQNPSLYVDVNIRGTQVLMDVVRQFPVKKFLFASSSSVYGNNEKVPFSEDDNVDRQISPYGATKKMGEVLLYTYHHLYGIPMALLRFFTVYGPRQRPEMAIHKFVRLLYRNRPIPIYGDGSTARDYTFIDDIIAGLWNVLHHEDTFAIYNLGNSEPVKLGELIEILAELTGREPRLDYQELPPGDVQQTFADISRAHSRLDYTPQTTISEGLGLFLEWYQAMKKEHPRLF